MHLEQTATTRVDHDLEVLAVDLADSPQLLVTVLNAIDDRVYVKNADGLIVFANSMFLDSFNLAAEQVVGQHCREFLPQEMIADCEAADALVHQRRQPMRVVTHRTNPNTGEVRYSETHKSPIINANGDVIGIVGTSRDITSRQRTKEELKQQKKLLELIVETVPDDIFVKDSKRRLLLGNQSFFNRLKLDPIESIGRELSPALPPDVQEISRKADEQVIATNQGTVGSIRLHTPDGGEQYMEFRKLPLIVDDETTGIVTVCRDLTEWKQAEEQSKRNESMLLHAARLSSLGELSAGIAHEVNQPLYSILNYAKAIRNKLQDAGSLDLEAISKWIDRIHSEAERGGEITRRLSAFAKPAETRPSATRIDTAIDESIRFVDIEARDAGVTVEQLISKDLPDLIFDRVQIQQVLVNLLKNAIEACVRAKTIDPRVVVSACVCNSEVEVSIADNGPGVDAFEGVNILDPFATTKHEGTGLGLAISKTIIEAHGGRLSYHANDAGGVTFRFSLPRERTNDPVTKKVEGKGK